MKNYIIPILFIFKAVSQFEKRSNFFIALDRSIAYPEGGGQLGDVGIVTYKEHSFPFLDTKK